MKAHFYFLLSLLWRLVDDQRQVRFLLLNVRYIRVVNKHTDSTVFRIYLLGVRSRVCQRGTRSDRFLIAILYQLCFRRGLPGQR